MIAIMSKKSDETTRLLLGILTITFVVLKLTHVIDWSWWWVLSPTLLPLSLALVALVIWGCVKLYIHLTSTKEQREARELASLLREMGNRQEGSKSRFMKKLEERMKNTKN